MDNTQANISLNVARRTRNSFEEYCNACEIDDLASPKTLCYLFFLCHVILCVFVSFHCGFGVFFTPSWKVRFDCAMHSHLCMCVCSNYCFPNIEHTTSTRICYCVFEINTNTKRCVRQVAVSPIVKFYCVYKHNDTFVRLNGCKNYRRKSFVQTSNNIHTHSRRLLLCYYSNNAVSVKTLSSITIFPCLICVFYDAQRHTPIS